jgi:hypothetical protein
MNDMFPLWAQRLLCVGTGVIREPGALQAAVIPAKAGIYSANLWRFAVDGLDSRFRGNDCAPNDTSTCVRECG